MTVSELVHRANGNEFFIALEAALPKEVAKSLISGLPTAKGKEALWPTTILYELRLEIAQKTQLQVKNEYLFVFAQKNKPARGGARMLGAKPHQDWRFVISRESNDKAHIRAEAQKGARAQALKVDATTLALRHIPAKSKKDYPAAVWLSNLLTKNFLFYQPDTKSLKTPSPPLPVRGFCINRKGKFGARLLAHYLLAHKGVKVSRRCVMAILAASNLTCQIRRKKKPVSSNSVKARAYDNQLAQYRKTAKPNEAWRTDITYIHTKNGFGYLAAVMDDYTRKIIGWAWSSRCDTDLALDALKMACVQRKAGTGIIVHSDRGAQYTSRAWQDMLAQRGMIGSMSAKGNCYDNASMERFFGTLKDEKVRGESLRSL